MESIQQVSSQLRGLMAELAGQASSLSSTIMGQPGRAGDANFTHVLGSMLKEVDNRQLDAAEKAVAVDSGRSDDVIGAVLSSQEASLSFSMLTQVRNKLSTALDDLLKMQI
ncbi:flagellar hook-basal body complex protein FliE [Burkholderia thailandensis]|uniref:flagellar hook-basal body complex protein FliE n=1 Tax=Burkholderia thailandensis TaxID=57975 RepID=UPI00016A45E7|nr:flagellar hook-basal body complex protein FliE [Burkholderia thailandensis]AIP65775.1 flagellar hook-basal body protein FliE [Burkholderia thailandensis]AOI53848.1 flagellar hook-basal body protein FliE [Burkholderia thailandensis]MCS3394444.1 flagellar hook-basal body complex protein FliE [Burkholderia thailandensis]MCS6427524.1 flagellar hook-basal body complex protein FliE [Burkholderia thailandensis]MCS6455792.1 flagellar hook-basal body complex protein FliE [Burkholderia thailandensis]